MEPTKTRIHVRTTRTSEMDGSTEAHLIAPDHIEQCIRFIRQQKVILDADLARFYEVTTSNLNLAVRRNARRFPPDFMFQLTSEEAALTLQSAISKKGRGGRRTLPYAFSEMGVAMLSSVLNSERAIQMNIAIMRAFARSRILMASNKELARHIEEIEARMTALLKDQSQKISGHEQAITGILKMLHDLTNPRQVRAIGFTANFSK
jgi:hypothetical protein